MHLRQRRGGYVLCRNPGTAGRHHPLCPSHHADSRLDGRHDYSGAIRIREDGPTVVHPGFSLRVPGPGHSPEDPVPAPGATQGRRHGTVTLSGLLHLLWERARYNVWYPAMACRRTYRSWCRHLSAAATDGALGRQALADLLWIPQRHDAPVPPPIARTGDGRHRAIVAGRLEVLEPARFGCAVRLAEARRPLYLSDAQADRLETSYLKCGPEQADKIREGRFLYWLIATVRLTPKGYVRIDELAGMRTDSRFVPVESTPELHVAGLLAEQGRAFRKPLRYDAREFTFPDFLLLDVGPEPLPMEVCGIRGDPRCPQGRQESLLPHPARRRVVLGFGKRPGAAGVPALDAQKLTVYNPYPYQQHRRDAYFLR